MPDREPATRGARVVVVGFGYWGPNLVRNMAYLPNEPLHGVCEQDQLRLAKARQLYPWVHTYRDYADVLRDDLVTAVVISTPAASHYELSIQALEAGKHVLVEKPLATRSRECAHLAQVARERSLVLMVGHTFLYAPAVQYLKAMVANGELGRIHYIYSSRLNLGTYRPDVNVVWDLAPHDVSIALHLTGEPVAAVSARAFSHAGAGKEDVAFLTLELASGTSVHSHVSWLDPNKVRKMTIVGSQRMAVYDDTDPGMTVRLYDKGVEIAPHDPTGSYGEFKLAVRTGDLTVPHLPLTEPLRAECMDFLAAVDQGRPCTSDADIGLTVVRVLEAATQSIAMMGERVELAPPATTHREMIA
jgi:predicted dehydrogenase